MERRELYLAIRLSWCKETASRNGERWYEHFPEIDQCAVTSMVIQDFLGGDLLRCKCDDGDSHYWNRLPDGTEVDLTYDQFYYLGVNPDKENYAIRDRAYVESFPDTMKRYTILREKVEALFK